MPKTTFVRKPCTLEDVRNRAAQIKERHGGEAPDSYYIAEEIQPEENTFSRCTRIWFLTGTGAGNFRIGCTP